MANATRETMWMAAAGTEGIAVSPPASRPDPADATGNSTAAIRSGPTAAVLWNGSVMAFATVVSMFSRATTTPATAAPKHAPNRRRAGAGVAASTAGTHSMRRWSPRRRQRSGAARVNQPPLATAHATRATITSTATGTAGIAVRCRASRERTTVGMSATTAWTRPACAPNRATPRNRKRGNASRAQQEPTTPWATPLEHELPGPAGHARWARSPATRPSRERRRRKRGAAGTARRPLASSGYQRRRLARGAIQKLASPSAKPGPIAGRTRHSTGSSHSRMTKQKPRAA
mmetsp:Transcript_15272/g.58074  ORF Transcript_15272/g.58074 Transcript_15272/m.58074 type:complete len:289 (+) Transcript_15272:150-1016(+)